MGNEITKLSSSDCVRVCLLVLLVSSVKASPPLSIGKIISCRGELASPQKSNSTYLNPWIVAVEADITMCTIITRYLLRNSTPFIMYSKVRAPAAERNKDPILEVLKEVIKVPEDDSSSHSCRILEISSGNGLHITHFANNLSKKIFWQPSEFDRKMFSSICAYMKEEKVQNVAPPIFIDIREPFQNWKPVNEVPDASDLKPILEFQENFFHYIYNANLMHISSFACTEGLFKNSGKLLKEQGSLITYGPYSQNGVITPESNVRFDTSLRATDPAWGLRDIQQQLVPLAEQNGLKLSRIIDMPANNKVLVWVKQ